MAKPAVLVVHGGWHTPWHYSLFLAELESRGFVVSCPHLPSQIKELPLPESANGSSDVVAVRTALETLVNAGHPVITFMHSYGAVPGNEALEGLLWSQRQTSDEWKQSAGGVVHCVYMAAFMLPIGTAMVTPFGGVLPPWTHKDDEGRMWIQEPRMAFYNDLPDKLANEYVTTTVYCPSKVCFREMTYAPWEAVHSGELDGTYLVCEQDHELKKPAAEGMATILGDRKRMKYIDAGHCAMVGQPGKVADIVLEAWEVSKHRLGL